MSQRTSRGSWIPQPDGSEMFISIGNGRDTAVPGSIRVPRSSTQPTSPGPATPSSGQDRLPLNIPRSSGVREIRPMGSRWSSSSDAMQLERDYQVNPNQPFGDHRPEQLRQPQPTFGSSPPVPRNLSELVSSPTQYSTTGNSRPSTAGSERPYTPTPTLEQTFRTRIRQSGMLYTNEMPLVDDPNATLEYLRNMEAIVRSRLATERSRREREARDEERPRPPPSTPRRHGRR